ncbi:MAG: glycosyltransferase family 4 protein [Candidatus Omnitrophica bacterium]|nr:glycosyltransferase family 4 protein [Candidatus Omnitrophota bacterium]
MKICIDAGIGLSSTEKGGIYYLLPELLDTLSSIDKENEYLIFGFFLKNYWKRIKNIQIPESNNFSLKILPFPKKFIKIVEEKSKIPFIETLLKREKISIYHGISATYLPLFKKIKTIYTIYDLSFEIMPEVYKEKWYSEIKSSAIRSDIIIVPSFSTKKDIMEIYKLPEERIKVVYLGVNHKVFRPIEKKYAFEKLKKYFSYERYILTVATSIKRKNIPFLFDIYKILKEKKIEEKLVIIVGTNYLKKDILKLAMEKNISEHVYCFSEIPKEDMPYFYSGAEIFIFLSLYEGFGLPVVEAMSCGAPVIVSNISSLPEIVQDAGIYVNPFERDDAVDKIFNILKNDNLKEDLREKGVKRSKIFTWENCIRCILNIYKEVLK